MAMTIMVELESPRHAAKITVAGIDTVAAARYTIERASPSGNTAGVRGYTNQPVDVDSVIARDYEAPLNLELVYSAIAYDDTGAIVETAVAPVFTVDWQECESWLCDLARPTNSLVLVVESLADLSFEFAAGVHRVLDRRDPVLTTLPAWTPAGELDVLTDTLGERDQVRALLGNGYPVLLRTSPDLGIGNLYLGVTGFVETRFLTVGTKPQRRFRVQTVQVTRPDPTLFVPFPPNTYANVQATYATYADLQAAVGTYDELAYTYPADSDAVPIAPWPPDDI